MLHSFFLHTFKLGYKYESSEATIETDPALKVIQSNVARVMLSPSGETTRTGCLLIDFCLRFKLVIVNQQQDK